MSSPPPTSFPRPVFFEMAIKTDLTHSGSACLTHMDPCLSFVSTDMTWSGQNSKWTCQTHGYDTAPTTVNPPRVLFSNIPEHLVGSIIFSLSCIYSGVLHVITTTGSCTTILSLLLCTKSPCKHPVYSAILSSVARRLDLNSWDWPGLIYSMWLWLAPFVPMWESSLLFYLLIVLAAVPLFTFLAYWSDGQSCGSSFYLYHAHSGLARIFVFSSTYGSYWNHVLLLRVSGTHWYHNMESYGLWTSWDWRLKLGSTVAMGLEMVLVHSNCLVGSLKLN